MKGFEIIINGVTSLKASVNDEEGIKFVLQWAQPELHKKKECRESLHAYITNYSRNYLPTKKRKSWNIQKIDITDNIQIKTISDPGEKPSSESNEGEGVDLHPDVRSSLIYSFEDKDRIFGVINEYLSGVYDANRIVRCALNESERDYYKFLDLISTEDKNYSDLIKRNEYDEFGNKINDFKKPFNIENKRIAYDHSLKALRETTGYRIRSFGFLIAINGALMGLVSLKDVNPVAYLVVPFFGILTTVTLLMLDRRIMHIAKNYAEHAFEIEKYLDLSGFDSIVIELFTSGNLPGISYRVTNLLIGIPILISWVVLLSNQLMS
ncbi:MAG: hypothetical protein K1566_16925 [Candidatus Thiodiazotropha sp. (ex. Lucinisca nassula)]|nr:hypothetical protein [Candidatus Thiodiazotropha sp. (ex. Lucinisca nassula)]